MAEQVDVPGRWARLIPIAFITKPAIPLGPVRMRVGKRAQCWVLPLILALPAAASAARLDIEPTGIENDHGLVRVAICTPETFTTKHCPFVCAAPAKIGSVTVSVEGIQPGQYAVQAYHDEDGNGRLRRGLFGIPEEAIGFSRDARVRLGVPSFKDAAIDVAEPATGFRLRHVGP